MDVATASSRTSTVEDKTMASSKQKSAARKNVRKAARAAKRKKTISRLPKKTCTSHSDTDAGDYTGLMSFDTATIRLVGHDTVRLTVELAESQAQQTMGLMERRTLAPDAGMLFLYSSVQPESSAFWMFRTRIPL